MSLSRDVSRRTVLPVGSTKKLLDLIAQSIYYSDTHDVRRQTSRRLAATMVSIARERVVLWFDGMRR